MYNSGYGLYDGFYNEFRWHHEISQKYKVLLFCVYLLICIYIYVYIFILC